MRVHIATHLFAPRPQGAFCTELAAHWARTGHEVVVFTADPVPPDRSSGYEVVGGLPLAYDRRSLPTRLASRLAVGAAAAIASARRARPDVLISAGVLPLVGASGLSHLTRGRGAPAKMIGWLFDLWPDVLTAHRPDSAAIRAAAAPLVSATNLGLRRAHDLVAISPHMQAVVAARVAGARRAPNVHTISLWATEGPDRAAQSSMASPTPARDSAARVPPLRAMYHGNLGLSYDFEPILGAAGRLGPGEVTFTLVGDGSRRDELARRIERDRLTNVELRPPLAADQFTASLETADVHLLPLRESWDGVSFPSKLLPYLAVGRPIVITGAPHGESAAVIRQTGCGVVVEGGADAFGAALQQLAHDPARRAAMGAAGRALYLRRYSAARAFAAWDALIAGSP